MSRPRVLIADDHRMLADAFAKILSDDYEVVGTVADGRELVEAAPGLEPDAIVLDISMPRLNGLDAARHLKALLPDVALVVASFAAVYWIATDTSRIGLVALSDTNLGLSAQNLSRAIESSLADARADAMATARHASLSNVMAKTPQSVPTKIALPTTNSSPKIFSAIYCSAELPGWVVLFSQLRRN